MDTLYNLNGKQITRIRKRSTGATGANAVQMNFVCDAQGKPMLLRYMDADYVYLHNLQRYVVDIVDMNSATVVECRYNAGGSLYPPKITLRRRLAGTTRSGIEVCVGLGDGAVYTRSRIDDPR